MAALRKPQTISIRLEPTDEDRKLLRAVNRIRKRHAIKSVVQVIRTAIMHMDANGGK